MVRRRLSRQQIRRIQTARETRRQRAAEHVATGHQTDDDLSREGERPGLVIANHGHYLLVESRAGTVHRCVARRNLEPPVTGDQVYWQATGDKTGVIVALETRKSTLARPDFSGKSKPLASNVDLLVVVVAPPPALNELLVDRYLVAAEAMGADAAIALNKWDTVGPEARVRVSDRLAVYEHIGYRVHALSAHTGEGMQALRDTLRGHATILLGQSGVGKSSLVNALAPGHNIAVGTLSEISGLGTHTTTQAALYHLAAGGNLIDSPGVRSFEPAIDAREVEPGFREIAPLGRQCRFSNCSHRVEPGCAVQAAVEDGRIDARRYQSLMQLRDALQAKG